MGVFFKKNDDQFYQIFFRNSVMAMLMIDRETLQIADANFAACKFYQYSYQELLEMKFSDLGTMKTDRVTTDVNLAASQIKNSFAFKHTLANGEIRSVRVHSSPAVMDGKQYLHMIILDITEQADYSRSSSQVQVLLDNLPFVAWFKDLQGRYLAVNKSFEDHYCCLKENVIGKYDFEIFSKAQADTFLFGDVEIITRRQKVSFEEQNAEGRWNEVFKSPIFNDYGNVIGTTGISRDITDKKLQEQALHEAELREMQLLQESMELKDSFLTMITHEFKTPIAIINAAVQTMEITCRDEINEKMQNYLNKIKQNSLRQQRLVENLLDITKLKAGRMKPKFKNVEIVSLTKEIVESVRIYADQKQLKLTFHSVCKETIVSTDMERYERILLNLLSNAIKYTPAKRSIDVMLHRNGQNLVISIKDKGIGIPEDKKLLIFERFSQADTSLTRQAEGTGTGLYLTKLFVESIGGSIHLTSREGFGSTFSFSLPIRQDDAPTSERISGSRIIQAASLEFSDILL